MILSSADAMQGRTSDICGVALISTESWALMSSWNGRVRLEDERKEK